MVSVGDAARSGARVPCRSKPPDTRRRTRRSAAAGLPDAQSTPDTDVPVPTAAGTPDADAAALAAATPPGPDAAATGLDPFDTSSADWSAAASTASTASAASAAERALAPPLAATRSTGEVATNAATITPANRAHGAARRSVIGSGLACRRNRRRNRGEDQLDELSRIERVTALDGVDHAVVGVEAAGADHRVVPVCAHAAFGVDSGIEDLIECVDQELGSK